MPVLYRNVGVTNEDFSVSYKMNIVIPIPTGTANANDYSQANFSSLADFGEYLDTIITPAGSTSDITDACTCITSSGPSAVDILLHGLSSSALQVSDVLSPRILWFGPIGGETTPNIKIRSASGQLYFDYRVGTTLKGTIASDSSGGRETMQFIPWSNGTDIILLNARGFYYNSDTGYWAINIAFRTKLLQSYALPVWWAEWYAGTPDLDDPYPGINPSTPSGPAADTGIPENDPVDIPNLPTLSVTDTGFVTLFNPTMSQVKNLADYMWNGLFDINNFKKIFADPMDCILGFNMVPVAVPSGAAANINIGNIVTSVSMNVATSQWIELDCGTIDIGLPYGSYLDFSPYTKFSIYLPYIGTCELSADDVAGKVLTLKYHVDALSCACVAYLKCGDHVLYQWTGSCGYSIPVTQNDFTRMITAIVSIAAAGIGGAVVGGASAAIMNAGAASAKNVSALKPEVHRSGAIGSSAGLMGGQTPYLIIEIPQACKPERQYHYTGYPGFITVTVGNLTGYAEFEEIILDGIGCTEEERSMIDSLCKGGIYV